MSTSSNLLNCLHKCMKNITYKAARTIQYIYIVCVCVCIYIYIYTHTHTHNMQGNLRERDQWGDPDVDRRITLRWIFRKWEGVVRTGWSWLRIGTGGGHM